MKESRRVPVTAVFDIGKTNKKFFLFDRDYTILRKQQTELDQTVDEDGDPCENLELLEYWVNKKIEQSTRDKDVQIEALNFSTYGASFVHLDKAGEAATPLYNYLKPHPEKLFRTFFEARGGKKKFSLQTASPPMGMLNSGFQLYWLKHAKPLLFEEISCSLHFPQYLSYLVTGQCTTELTSIGCHTALWNFEQGRYHQWLQDEGLLDLLPSQEEVSTTREVLRNGSRFEAGIGIHDSSAALVPYLLTFEEPFLLVSTGTWSITFNPFSRAPLTFDELQKDCLCYLNIYGNQVKSSRLFLGSEFKHQKQKMDQHFKRKRWQNHVELDVGMLNKLVQNPRPDRKLKLEKAYNSGPFPRKEPGRWQLDAFATYEEAYHQLMLDLAAIQVESIQLAEGKKEVDRIILTGGFSQNDFFVSLLASFFPDKKVFTSSLPNASALGAAMVVNPAELHSGDRAELKKLLALQQQKPVENLKIASYSWK